MKKIFLVFAVLALAGTSASAQNSAHSKFAKNYRVCLIGNTYQVCDANAPKATDLGRTTETGESFGMSSTEVHMGYSSNARYRSRIRVTYDNMNNPYEGKPSMANDGVQKNIQRNINYLDAANPLPPNDGGNTSR
jgi:hypothetical protein